MQPDDFGHFPGSTITEMAMHRIPYHFTDLLECVTLSMDAMTERRGSISTIYFILPDLKDDFRAHGSTLRLMPFHFKSCKTKAWAGC